MRRPFLGVAGVVQRVDPVVEPEQQHRHGDDLFETQIMYKHSHILYLNASIKICTTTVSYAHI